MPAIMSFLSMQLTALVLFLLSSSTSATLPFGHYGPEGAVLFLNGFHFVSGHTDWEISANHYCVIISDEMLQCAIYTTGTSPARLAGIEYIITGDAFETLEYEGTHNTSVLYTLSNLIKVQSASCGIVMYTKSRADFSLNLTFQHPWTTL